jgi:hypothetical protein
MASLTDSIAFRNWFPFFAVLKSVYVLGSNPLGDLNDLIKNLILVAFYHPPIINKCPDAQTLVLASATFEKNPTILSK